MRLQGELPVRWASLEVLEHGKYSKASDVWAFGVLVYEVMSFGELPYSEFATNVEVITRIKNGYTLKCPPNCRAEVHELAMKPCWRPTPSTRPGFTELRSVLEDLGATPSEEEGHTAAPKRNESQSVTGKGRGKRRSSGDDGLAEWQAGLNDRALLGPSVHHVANVLVPAVFKVVSADNDSGIVLDRPIDATIAHAVRAVAKPAGANTECPRDGLIGCAYVDTLSDRNDVGRAIALLSYTWGYKVESVGSALLRWTEQSGQEPTRAYIWICSLCLNQHRIEKVLCPEALAAEFGPRVRSIGRILPMLEPYVKSLCHLFLFGAP